MTKLAVALCVVIGASLGTIVGSTNGESERARGRASAATDDITRSAQLRGEVDRLREQFASIQRDFEAAQTPAAATAAQEKLFQLRVDMVAVEDEIAVLARRRAAADNF